MAEEAPTPHPFPASSVAVKLAILSSPSVGGPRELERTRAIIAHELRMLADPRVLWARHIEDGLHETYKSLLHAETVYMESGGNSAWNTAADHQIVRAGRTLAAGAAAWRLRTVTPAQAWRILTVLLHSIPTEPAPICSWGELYRSFAAAFAELSPLGPFNPPARPLGNMVAIYSVRAGRPRLFAPASLPRPIPPHEEVEPSATAGLHEAGDALAEVILALPILPGEAEWLRDRAWIASELRVLADPSAPHLEHLEVNLHELGRLFEYAYQAARKDADPASFPTLPTQAAGVVRGEIAFAVQFRVMVGTQAAARLTMFQWVRLVISPAYDGSRKTRGELLHWLAEAFDAMEGLKRT